MEEYKTLLVEIDRNRKTEIIYFNRPDSLNALNYQLALDLKMALEKLLESQNVKCLVITGKGKAFCSGGDLLEFKNTENPQDLLSKLASTFHESLKIINKLKIPVIAAINGPCIGAGLGLVGACDIRVCSINAKFGSAFTSVGLSPNSSLTYNLPRIMSSSFANDLIFSNRIINAEEALKFHLVSRIIESIEKFMEKVMELANQISSGPPIAMALAKELLTSTYEDNLEHHLEKEARNVSQSAATQDFKEGVKAYFEKRKPEYNGR